MQNRPVAQTAKLIGMPWTIMILRDLTLNKTRRYEDHPPLAEYLLTKKGLFGKSLFLIFDWQV